MPTKKKPAGAAATKKKPAAKKAAAKKEAPAKAAPKKQPAARGRKPARLSLAACADKLESLTAEVRDYHESRPNIGYGEPLSALANDLAQASDRMRALADRLD